MPMTRTLAKPAQSESDVNISPRRAGWAARSHDDATRALLERDAKAFLHQSVSTPCLDVIVEADGIWITDMAGRRFMDFHGNNVHHIGYGHPRLKRAIADQMDTLPFAPRRFACEPAVELAEKLVEITPEGLTKVLFATGGSDAVEIALKLARLATGRHKTISFWDSFHGAGFGASSVGGEELFRSPAFGPLLPGTFHVHPFGSGEYDDPLGPARAIAEILEREGDIAAVIAEPVRATTAHLPPPGFWKAVREACDAHGTLLIFDEIPAGLGKTGHMFATHAEGVTPDMIVVGKSLGGGIVPIASVICRTELDVAGDFAIGHYTHEKNPVLARAALTTIQIIEDEELVDNANTVGARALARMAEMKERHALIGDVRGRGLLLGIELTGPDANDAAEAVMYAALDQGLSFKTAMGNILSLTPPLVTTHEHMDRALDIIDEALGEIERTG